MLLDLSQGRTAFILSMFVSMVATFLAAPLESEWVNQDKLEILEWCLPLERDSREAQQVYKHLIFNTLMKTGSTVGNILVGV